MNTIAEWREEQHREAYLVLDIQIHPAALVRVEGGDWFQLSRTEFRLLSVLLWKRDRWVTFRKLHWQLWEFEEPRETVALARSRRMLMEELKRLAPDRNWAQILRRDQSRGYGPFLSDSDAARQHRQVLHCPDNAGHAQNPVVVRHKCLH
jgi:DNA-binding response OmpR family regulator